MSASNPRFEFPQPSTLPNNHKLVLWATNYYVFSANARQEGEPLLDVDGNSLGVLVTPADFCLGGIEGTIRVAGPNGQSSVFNFAGKGAHQQVDCGAVLHSQKPAVTGAGRVRYQKAGGPFGDGVHGLFLVPYRSIAVDKAQSPITYESVIYIPAARGQALTLPSGEAVVHDGYFFAADTGGAIKNNHIDVFTGIQEVTPFGFVKSKPQGTFEAFVIDAPEIKAQLMQDHRTP